MSRHVPLPSETKTNIDRGNMYNESYRMKFCTANISVRMKKNRLEATQTLRAGCSKADPQTHKQTGAITILCAA